MTRIFCTGDCHGDVISRFSYKKNPELRELTDGDIMIIAGDFGIPFGVAAPYYNQKYRKGDIYQLKFLESKPWLNIAICGNHDDRIAVSYMPHIFSSDGIFQGIKFDPMPRLLCVDGMVSRNTLIIDEPTIAEIDGKTFWFIPGGTSHDADIILDPNSPHFETELNHQIKLQENLWRIKDWEWWPDEVINIEKLQEQMEIMQYKHIDCIISHEGPASIHRWYKREGFPARMAPTEGEEVLELIRTGFNFDSWITGHYHVSQTWPMDNRMMTLYHAIIELFPNKGE